MNTIPVLNVITLTHPVLGVPIGELRDVRDSNVFIAGVVAGEVLAGFDADTDLPNPAELEDPLAFAMGVVVNGELVGGGSFYDISIVEEDLGAGTATVEGRILLTVPSLPEAVQAITAGINGYVATAKDPSEPFQQVTFQLKA
jgi:hypothetical protein